MESKRAIGIWKKKNCVWLPNGIAPRCTNVNNPETNVCGEECNFIEVHLVLISHSFGTLTIVAFSVYFNP